MMLGLIDIFPAQLAAKPERREPAFLMAVTITATPYCYLYSYLFIYLFMAALGLS